MICRLRLIAALIVLGAPVLDAEPLTRSGAVALALERNPAVAAGEARWRAAESDALLATAPPRPELELEYEGLPGVFDLGRYGERTIGVTQRLAFPVRWRKRVQAARQEADGVRFSAFEAARADVAFAVRMAYDAVLANDLIHASMERHVRLSEELVRQARARFEAGDVGRLDVMRAEVAASRLENELVSARTASRRSRARLNALLGIRPDAALVLSDSLGQQAAGFDLEVLTSQALRQRPELVAADHDLRAATSARAAARASVFPDVSFGVARQTVAGGDETSSFWRTGISLELPLYLFLDSRARIIRASAEQELAEAEKEAVRLRVVEEVHAAFLQLREADERLQRMVERVAPAANAALDAARRSYDAGEATSLEYLSAQQDLVEVEIELVEARLDYRTAEAGLRRAAGEDPLGPFDSSRSAARTEDRKGE